MKLTSLILRNVRRNPKNFVFASVGIVLGISTFMFFVALGLGVRKNVLEKVYVVDQVEVVPRSIQVGAIESRGLFASGTGLDDYTVEDIMDLEGVVEVYPKQHLSFPAYAIGGETFLGYDLRTELIAEGIPAELVDGDYEGSDDPYLAFRDWGGVESCTEDVECGASAACVEGQCVADPCVPDDEIWVTGARADAERGINEITQRTDIRSRSLLVRDGGELVPEDERYRIVLRTGDRDDAIAALNLARVRGTAVPLDGAGCREAPAYCEPMTRECVMPVPVLVSYTLLELYNGNVQSSLDGSSGSMRNLPRLTASGFIGMGFDGILGEGYLGESTAVDEGDADRERIRLRIVGFSHRAMPVGATLPLGYVTRWNGRYAPERPPDEYHSLLVVTEDSRVLHRVAHEITEELELELDDRYEQSKRASLMITLVTAVLALLSVLIVSLAALNIMHTFLMVIAERRTEIGVLRAVGATRLNVYAMIFSEALLIALVASALAASLALAGIGVTDQAFANATPDFPFKPDSLFFVPAWLVPLGFGISIVFCLLGAWLPAVRAARMEPAQAVRA